MEMKTDFSKILTTENAKVFLWSFFLNKIIPFFQLSECEEIKNGNTDITQDNKHCIAIVTNQL